MDKPECVAATDDDRNTEQRANSACNDLLSASIVDFVLSVLNRAVETDRTALTLLIGSRVPCNDELADDPTIQCGDDPPTVGPLGLLNGVLGVDSETGYGPIQAVFDDGGILIRFERSPKCALSR